VPGGQGQLVSSRGSLALADPEAALLGAPQIAATGYRLPRVPPPAVLAWVHATTPQRRRTDASTPAACTTPISRKQNGQPPNVRDAPQAARCN
jgi:hypothetical protein